MKYKISITIAALLSASSAWAVTTSAYYSYEILSPDTGDSNYGPFASAISDKGVVGVYATKAVVDQNLDVGLPYTFNQACFYDDEVCDLIYSGSDSSSDLSYDNAYKAWRVATAQMDQGILDPESYFMGAADDVEIIGFGSDTDVAITDVAEIDGTSLVVGYGSAPYSDGERDFVRRGFVTTAGDSSASISLLPDYYGDDDEGVEGGFTSAYKIRTVTYSGGDTKTLIIGSSSKSLAGGDSEYFDYCYNEGDDDDGRYKHN